MLMNVESFQTNDIRCQELGWTCTLLAVETYGNWGMEAQYICII